MHQKRKKIFYVPDLISLLVLPFILFLHNPFPPKQTVLKLNLPSDEINKQELAYGFSSAQILKEIRSLSTINIYLNGDHELNKQKLSFVQTDAHRLQKNMDASTIIKVHFSKDVTYEEFVALINILNKGKIKRYAWVNDFMVIFGERKSSTINYSHRL